jgi:hypothetical protein
MSDVDPYGVRMTGAARATLDEYMALYERRIIAEAAHLSPGGILTPGDVVNSVEALEARRRGPALNPSVLSDLYPRGGGWGTIIALATFAIVLLVAGSILNLYSDLPSQWTYALMGAGIGSVVLIVFLMSRGAIGDRSRERKAFARLAYEVESAEKAHWDRVNETRADLHQALGTDRPTVEKPPGRRSSHRTETSEFLQQWMQVEVRIRSLARAELGMDADVVADYPIGPLLDRLTSLGVLDERRSGDIGHILTVRNAVAHGERASEAELRVGLDYLREVETYLDKYAGSHKRRPASDL